MYRIISRAYEYGDMGDMGSTFVDENYVFTTLDKARTYTMKAAIEAASRTMAGPTGLRWKSQTELTGSSIHAEIVEVVVDPI